MAAPTFVTSTQSAWNTTTSPKTVALSSVAVNVGDLIVSLMADENDNGTENYTWTSSPTETWIEHTETAGTTNSDVLLQSARTTVTGSWVSGSVTCTRTTGAVENYGQVSAVFRNHNGIGNVANSGILTGTAPSYSFTTAYDNSAIVVIFGDYAARDGAARSYSSINGSGPTELAYSATTGVYAMAAFVYTDAGAAGSKTITISGWNATVDARMHVVEVRGIPAGTVHSAAGTIALTSGVAGTIRARRPVSGAVSITTAQSGSLHAIRHISALLAGATGTTSVSGTVTARRPVSGSVAITSGVSGNATVVSGTTVHSVSGTIALSSGSAGSITARRRVSGTVPIITTVAGTASGPPQVYSVSGTVEVVSGVTGQFVPPVPTGTFVFTPPTHEEPIRTLIRGVAWYRLTHANSVVDVGGTFVSIRSPGPEYLDGLEEGVGYFRGGHTYIVSAEIAARLAGAGYETTALAGYGSGNYGTTGFGY